MLIKFYTLLIFLAIIIFVRGTFLFAFFLFLFSISSDIEKRRLSNISKGGFRASIPMGGPSGIQSRLTLAAVGATYLPGHFHRFSVSVPLCTPGVMYGDHSSRCDL